MNTTTILIDGLFLGIAVWFMLTLALKWRLIEYYEIHRKKWMPERCDFCLSFWLSLLIAIILSLYGMNLLSTIVSVAVVRLLTSFIYARN